MSDSPIRAVIAEDHQFFRDGLRAALQCLDCLSVIGESSDGVTALEHAREQGYDELVRLLEETPS